MDGWEEKHADCNHRHYYKRGSWPEPTQRPQDHETRNVTPQTKFGSALLHSRNWNIYRLHPSLERPSCVVTHEHLPELPIFSKVLLHKTPPLTRSSVVRMLLSIQETLGLLTTDGCGGVHLYIILVLKRIRSSRSALAIHEFKTNLSYRRPFLKIYRK